MHGLPEFRLSAAVLIGECHTNQNLMKYSRCESKIKYMSYN